MGVLLVTVLTVADDPVSYKLQSVMVTIQCLLFALRKE